MENIIFTLENGNTVEQLTRDRKTYLGGSSVAAILGVSKYKTALDIYNEKIYGNNITENLPMKMGKFVESFILDEYEKLQDKIQYGFRDVNVYSSDYDFIGAQLDWIAVTYDKKIIVADAKLKGQIMAQFYGEEYTSDIPPDEKCQLALQRYLMDAEYVDMPVLFAPTELKIYRYTKDEKFEAFIIKKLVNFWNNHVIPAIPPAPASQKDLNLLFPQSNNASIEINIDTLDMIEKLKFCKTKILELEKEEETLALEVKKALGPNEIGTYGGIKLVSLKSHERQDFDRETFKKSYPVLYKTHLKTKSIRTLRLY